MCICSRDLMVDSDKRSRIYEIADNVWPLKPIEIASCFPRDTYLFRRKNEHAITAPSRWVDSERGEMEETAHGWRLRETVYLSEDSRQG